MHALALVTTLISPNARFLDTLEYIARFLYLTLHISIRHVGANGSPDEWPLIIPINHMKK